MLIRYMSDIHLEFGWMHILGLEEDKDTVLVLAGDIGLVYNPAQLEMLGRFLVDASVRFRSVIYILGNHEHYNYSITKTYDTVCQLVANRGLENVFVRENETKVIDDVAFICATLWTNYNHNPVTATICEQHLNDHRIIRIGPVLDPYERRFKATDARRFFDHSKQFVFDQIKEHKAAGNKTVVVVHHGVSGQSTHPRFKGDLVNAAFISELTEDILEAQPNIIIHGHVHDAFDYMIGDTHVLVNPRGYVGSEAGFNGFDPVARIEV